jgi:hypothetical protein
MFALVFVIALGAVVTPAIAIVLVSVASRREDRDWTLGRSPSGLAQVAARRVLGFWHEGAGLTQPRDCVR